MTFILTYFDFLLSFVFFLFFSLCFYYFVLADADIGDDVGKANDGQYIYGTYVILTCWQRT